MPYEVKLAVFEGPIDLLLHLITRRRVDIYDVSLSTITEEYVTAISEMQGIDLETATGFLVVAATLLELKSARLLPDPGGEEGDTRLLEERDLLLARLVECATYREAGSFLGAQLVAGERYFPRAVPVEPQFVPAAPDLLAKLTLDDLVAAATKVFEPQPQVELDVSHVAPIRVSVGEAILDLAGGLSSGPRTFESLCRGSRHRIEVVVRFLALLELFKAGAVEIEQAGSFGTIVARWTGEVPAAVVLEEAEEYAMTEERE